MPDTPSKQHEIIAHLYDVAVDPTSYERLLDYWEEMIRPARERAANPDIVGDSVAHLEGHFERAEKLIGHTLSTPPDEEADKAVARVRNTATFAVTEDGTLSAVNLTAMRVFGLSRLARLNALPIESDDIERLHAEARRMLRSNGPSSGVLCARTEAGGRLLIIQMRLHRPPAEPAYVLCMTSEINWPAGFAERLKDAFRLSMAEVDVLRHLADGHGVNDIALLRARSVDTIRFQIKSILAKTGARSQLELVRIAISTAEMLHLSSPDTDAVAGDAASYTPLATRRFELPGGRQMDYLILGDPDGAPVLYLPLDFGFVRWPAPAEARAKRQGLRIIVGIRAGYGESSPVPEDANYVDQLVADHLALLDHLGIARVPVISLGGDSFLAFRLHAAAPERVRALICCSGTLPATEATQYERMDKWHRFILTSARFTPRLLPFMVKAGFALARAWGKASFISAVYEGSKADTETFKLPEVRDALVHGSDVAFSEKHSAHKAFAQEIMAHERADWKDALERLEDAARRGDVDVHFLNGEQDPQVPVETLREFRTDYPWIDFTVYPDAGQLLFFLKWRDVIARVCRYV